MQKLSHRTGDIKNLAKYLTDFTKLPPFSETGTMIKPSTSVRGFENKQVPFVGIIVTEKSKRPNGIELVATERLIAFGMYKTTIFEENDITVGEILLSFPKHSSS